ncbi:hypothetical protein F5B22DRAFT_635534 [Xylaria bambusicola]|uniref:uncharacterized protein n=1 Tax=Xylaria bambusicola TaxID=326684 RepID=UPI0020082824|nr:uncharacterized protein F5B22DRAFT_635534 [Xylaria bambusicola]KAI0518049.1 hypothetical protein F5B22DRAFT_635534 [Xylaria bambusicola]
MPPSLSSIERNNPPPRRKSCAACIKAKRRCDLHQPSCLRCTQRRIDCSYPAPAGTHPKRRGDTSSSPSQSETSPTAQAQDELIMKDVALTETSTSWESSFDFNIDLSPAYTINASCAPFPNISFDEPAFHGLEFLDDVADTHNLNPMMPTPAPTVELGLEDPMPLIQRPKSTVPNFSRIDLLRAASELTDKRLRYTIDVYKSAPEEMVLTGGTPWSHPALYQDSMPLCLEDAVAASGLYRAKNSINGPMIQRIVELRYRRLLAAPVPPSIPEQLARTHAIILYQIMLFFDESCPSRALSQETVSVLVDSAIALLEHADYESPDSDADSPSSRSIPLYPLTAARALYADWVFQESLRRTLLIAFLLSQMQSLLQADFSSFIPRPFDDASLTAEEAECFGPSDAAPSDASALAVIRLALQEQQQQQQQQQSSSKRCDPSLLLCQSFTLSAHLWHARDAVDFAVAWRNKKHLVVKPFNIWKRIDTAQVDDIDKLGRMIMTSGMGMEEAKGWFASRGGSL